MRRLQEKVFFYSILYGAFSLREILSPALPRLSCPPSGSPVIAQKMPPGFLPCRTACPGPLPVESNNPESLFRLSGLLLLFAWTSALRFFLDRSAHLRPFGAVGRCRPGTRAFSAQPLYLTGFQRVLKRRGGGVRLFCLTGFRPGCPLAHFTKPNPPIKTMTKITITIRFFILKILLI